MFKKLVVFTMTLMLAAGLLAGCGGASGGGEASNTGQNGDGGSAAVLKIGSTGPLTGDAAIYGVAVKQGAEIAVAEINEANPDLQIQFQMEDDQADAEMSVNAYNKLKDWGVQMVMGSVTSGSCVTMAGEAFADRVFVMTPSASSADVTADKDNVFQICFTDPNQGIKAAENIVKDFPDKKVACIYNAGDPYSTGIFNAFKKEYEDKSGSKLVAEESYPNDKTEEFGSYINSCKSAGADLIFLPIYYTPASKILEQSKAKNYSPIFFGVDGLDGLLDIEGYDLSLTEGVYLQTPVNPWSEDEKVAAFVEKYKEKYDEIPNQFAADGYDGIYVLYNAFKEAKLTVDQSNEDICDGMISTITGGFSYDGVTGTAMTWNETGEVSKTPNVCVIQDGKYVDVK